MFRGLAFQYGDPETDIPVGTMGLLMDPEHALFRDFPTEFHSNWQWWPIAKASRPVILDITPDEYRPIRSEEHTSELQSRGHLVCRLLLEKKKTRPHAAAQDDRGK